MSAFSPIADLQVERLPGQGVSQHSPSLRNNIEVLPIMTVSSFFFLPPLSQYFLSF